MKTISVQDKLIIQKVSGNSLGIVPKETYSIGYKPEFVAKIMRSRHDSKKDKVTFIKTENLWK